MAPPGTLPQGNAGRHADLYFGAGFGDADAGGVGPGGGSAAGESSRRLPRNWSSGRAHRPMVKAGWPSLRRGGFRERRSPPRVHPAGRGAAPAGRPPPPPGFGEDAGDDAGLVGDEGTVAGLVAAHRRLGQGLVESGAGGAEGMILGVVGGLRLTKRLARRSA